MAATPEMSIDRDLTEQRSAGDEPDWPDAGCAPLALRDLIAVVLQVQRLIQVPRSQRSRITRVSAQVCCYEQWMDENVQRDLAALLESFFAERFNVRLESWTGDRPPPMPISETCYGERPTPQGTVIAFWPGLESLAGALASTAAGDSPTTLVTLGGDASMVREARERRLHRSLREVITPGTVHTVAGNLVTEANRSSVTPSRLLHLVWAAVVALRAGQRQVHFFENGIDSHRLSLGFKAIATRKSASSSASWSPRTVSREAAANLQRLLSRVIEDDFSIVNPFVDLTPTEVAGGALATGRSPEWHARVNELICESSASTHETIADHCVAMLGALIARRESVQVIAPPLWSVLEAGLQEGVAAAYVRTIRGLSDFSGSELLSRLAMLGMVTASALDEPQVADLVRRHVATVRRVLVELVRQQATRLVAGELPVSSLAVQAATPEHAASQDPGSESLMFRRQGTCWEIRGRDGETHYLKHVVGMAYLHILIRGRDRLHSAVDLRWQVTGRPGCIGSGGGDLSDDEAIAQYLRAVRHRESALQRARNDNDLDQAEKISQELGWLEREISRSRGLGGRRRDTSDKEQARKAVCNAIGRALARIAQECPELAEHLRSSIRLGHTLCYAPRQPVDWVT